MNNKNLKLFKLVELFILFGILLSLIILKKDVFASVFKNKINIFIYTLENLVVTTPLGDNLSYTYAVRKFLS